MPSRGAQCVKNGNLQGQSLLLAGDCVKSLLLSACGFAQSASNVHAIELLRLLGALFASSASSASKKVALEIDESPTGIYI